MTKHIFAFLFLISLGFVSCNNDEEDTIAQINVVNEEGQRVGNAAVAFTCQSSYDPPRPCNIQITGQANSSGFYERKFDLPAVLVVSAFRVVRDTTVVGVLPDTTMIITRDSLCGESFISIQEGETTKKTVVVYECN